MSGVYQIYNPINNKRYIGSSINVERRLKEHLRNLKKNTHCNVHLQSAYNKYKDVLQFQFLEECEPDECLIFEQYYLDYYKSYNREFGYNCMSEEKKKETIDKIRVKTIERYKDYKNKKNNIFIKAIFDNGECKYFYAYKDASRQLKIDKGSIRYAFKFKNGRCDKIKATFVKITEEEYKNKTKK